MNWISPQYTVGLVSVIIPTYNREIFLSQAIESVIAQTYRPIECIVVDDGSTDNTKKTVERITELVDSGFRLIYIKQKNAGAQVARNTGTILSKGEYIQYLDSDDLLYADKLTLQVKYLINNDNVDGVFGDWEKGMPDQKELKLNYEDEDLVTQLLTEKCITNFAFLMRRNIINNIGHWDEKLKRNQEIDFQVRGLLEGGKYKYQPLVCGLWRIHDGERIANTSGLKESVNFFRKWENILTGKKLFSRKIKNNIANMYFGFTTNNNNENQEEKVALLMEAVRLNPDILFINTSKMRILRKLFGLKTSIKMWLLRVGVIHRNGKGLHK